LCNNCQGLTSHAIEQKFRKEIVALDSMVKDLEIDVSSHLMEAQNLEQKLEKNMGAHEKMFTDGLKELHTEEQSYHGKLLCLKKVIYVLFFSGGSLNGKDCEKILRSALNSKEVKDCPILVCISKTMGDRADKYLTLFKVLGNVWTTLRMPNDKIDDEDLAEMIKYCQEWGKLLPKLFPERNITRKGHTLSMHIPEYITKYRSFYRYYKLEQSGESIHSQMNNIGRKLAPIRPKSLRLFKTIEQYEMMHNVDKKHIEKRKKKQSGKTMAVTMLTTLGIILLCIAI
jgi:hypothetical protein